MLLGSLGAVSKIVLLFLFLFSVISWAVILYKWRVFKTADREDQRFFTAFAKIRDFEEELIHYIAQNHPELRKDVTTISKIDDKVGGKLKEVIAAFKKKMGYGAK